MKSLVWKHFSCITPKEARCNICSKIVKISGGTSNLRAHMKKWHNSEFAQLNNASIPRNSVDAEDVADGLGPEESGHENGEVQPIIKTEWSNEATQLLIENYKLHKGEFSNKNKKRYEVWAIIAKELQSNGHSVNGQACDKKMRSLKQRYRIIKDRINLNGRDAMTQWQYLSAMDEAMAGDPSVQPADAESSIRIVSSNIHEDQTTFSMNPSTDAPYPSVCLIPSPSTSPVCIMTSPVLSTVESSVPSGESFKPPSEKRPRRSGAMDSTSFSKVFTNQNKLMENIVSGNSEFRTSIEELMNYLRNQYSTSEIQKEHKTEKQELQKKVEELNLQLLQGQKKHYEETRALQEQHKEEIKELQQQHRVEISELQQQRQQELKEQQERFCKMQHQHQEQLLQVFLNKNQQK